MATAVLAALAVVGCASSSTELTPSRVGVSAKKQQQDTSQCEQVAEKTLASDTDRSNRQTATVVGSTIGAGLIGLAVSSAMVADENKAVTDKVRNNCLAKKGYKLVPKNPD